MWFLYINLGVGALTFILYILTVFEAAREFKIKYPNLKKKAMGSVIGSANAIFKLLIISLLPILNLFYFFTMLFNGEKIKEAAIAKVYLKRSMEEIEAGKIEVLKDEKS